MHILHPSAWTVSVYSNSIGIHLINFLLSPPGLLLTPGVVHCKRRKLKFCDVWTGAWTTFAKAEDSGDIYTWGLNNYYQIGQLIKEPLTLFLRSLILQFSLLFCERYSDGMDIASGFDDMVNRFVPDKCPAFKSDLDWKELSGGQHHTLALDKNGWLTGAYSHLLMPCDSL